MAEFVDCHTEEMLVEYELMQHNRLFSKNEIGNIAKKRKDLEYKIQRRTKCKEDFLRYIQNEMDVFALVKERKNNAGISHDEGEIEYAIANRVNHLFRQVITSFQDDVQLWISYIKFCKKMRFKGRINQILLNLLNVHGDKPQLWNLAAIEHYEVNQEIDVARQYLFRGIRLHPDSKILYTEAFRFELQFTALLREKEKIKQKSKMKVKTEKQSSSSTPVMESTECKANQSDSEKIVNKNVSDQVLEGQTAEAFLESAMQNIHDIEFFIQMLNICKEYDFTEKLKLKTVTHLSKAFPSDELTWDTIARLQLAGLPFVLQEENASMVSQNIIDRIDDQKNKNSMKKKITVSSDTYITMAKKLHTEGMWTFYLEFLLELQNQNQTKLPNYKKKLLKDALQGAYTANCMQEKYYLLWIDMLKSAKKIKKSKTVLRAATERIPTSVDLWLARLRLHVEQDEEVLGEYIFEQAIEHLGTDSNISLPLWKMMIQYKHIKDISKAEEIFKKGIYLGSAVSLSLKPLYIEWLVLAKGIVAGRKMYDVISKLPPLSLEVHSKMAFLERIQPSIDIKAVRKCYEIACTQFGTNNIDIWLEFLKFEFSSCSGEKVSDIYRRALKNLDPSLVDNFTTNVSLMKAGSISLTQMSS